MAFVSSLMNMSQWRWIVGSNALIADSENARLKTLRFRRCISLSIAVKVLNAPGAGAIVS